jgi:hypothetical protein
MTRQYRAAAGRARNAAEKTAGFWTQGARTVTDLVPGLPQVDLVPVVERYFELVQRTVDINRHFAVRWAEAVGTLSGVVREKAEAAGNVVREQAEKAEQAALEQAEKAEQAEKERARQARQAEREQAEQAEKERARQARQAEREQAEKAAREQAEQAEKERARQARQAEREQARRAHKRARERYEGRTKAELSDQLAKRELPKTGNVDELIERLVEADSK